MDSVQKVAIMLDWQQMPGKVVFYKDKESEKTTAWSKEKKEEVLKQKGFSFVSEYNRKVQAQCKRGGKRKNIIHSKARSSLRAMWNKIYPEIAVRDA